MQNMLLLVFCAGYCLSPIDIIPDVILGVGWLDDLGVIGLTMKKILENQKAHR